MSGRTPLKGVVLLVCCEHVGQVGVVVCTGRRYMAIPFYLWARMQDEADEHGKSQEFSGYACTALRQAIELVIRQQCEHEGEGRKG